MSFFSLLIQESVTIARPLDEVFRLVARWDLLLPRIDPDVLSLQKTTDGPAGVGTVYREVLRTGPMNTEIVATFTEFYPPHSYRYTAIAQTLDGGGHMQCVATEAGTEFHVHLHGKPRGLGWVLIPVLKRDMARRERARLATMKRLMESGELVAP